MSLMSHLPPTLRNLKSSWTLHHFPVLLNGFGMFCRSRDLPQEIQRFWGGQKWPRFFQLVAATENARQWGVLHMWGTQESPQETPTSRKTRGKHGVEQDFWDALQGFKENVYFASTLTCYPYNTSCQLLEKLLILLPNFQSLKYRHISPLSI